MAIRLGQSTKIFDKRGRCGLANMYDVDVKQLIPEYTGCEIPYVSLLWFYRFTPVQLKRTGYYLEVYGSDNTNDEVFFLVTPYEELKGIETVQTMESE